MSAFGLARLVVFIASLIPLARLFWLVMNDGLSANPVEFVTRSTVRLPVGSSSEIRQAWRARGLPPWLWLPSLLREGTPSAAFRIETRAASAGAKK